MRLKKKLVKYTNEMNIPNANRVLPEDVLRQMENQEKEAGRASGIRAYSKWIYSGTGIALTGIAALVIALNVNSRKNANNADGNAGYNYAYIDGVVGGKTYTDSLKGEASIYEEDMVKGEGLAYGDATDVETPMLNSPGAVAGTLTGGEIRDNINWDNWISSRNSSVLADWRLGINDRVSVYIHNGDTPLFNCKVVLMSNQETVYTAITDVKGNAYLFTFGQLRAVDCDTIMVTGSDGRTKSYTLSEIMDSKNNVDIELDGTNPDKKLDLMFMIDTTGSMGDELEYLKEELKNVVVTVNKDTGVDIRTSVNFYRDTSDDYVVKYYDFRKDIDEACKLIDNEKADGGGDIPEAVHTALDNAVNKHVWDEESIKLMFLVLDAPPHDDNSIKAEIADIISKAAKQGIRIIPVAASGAEENTQQILRAYAMLTGGTFTFLDDNSGIGASHTLPVKENEYESEYFNAMLIRIISDFCGNPSDSKYFRKNTNSNSNQ